MIETALNAIWLLVASGVLVVAPRCTTRTRIALLCAVALLFPIISISDDFNNDASSRLDVAALAVLLFIAIVFVAIARIAHVEEPRYAIALITPSDPRSPPAR